MCDPGLSDESRAQGNERPPRSGENRDPLRQLLRERGPDEERRIQRRSADLNTVVEDLLDSDGPVPDADVVDGSGFTASTPPDGVRKARALLDEGRAAAGRTDPHRIVVYRLTATGPDATARLRAELEAESDGSVPDLGAAGEATAVAKAVQRLADAGADTVVLQPTADEPDPEGFVRFAAEEVRPLVP